MIEGPGPLTPAAHSRAEIEGGFFFSSASAFHDRKPAFAVFSVRCPVPFLLGDHIFPSIFRFFFPWKRGPRDLTRSFFLSFENAGPRTSIPPSRLEETKVSEKGTERGKESSAPPTTPRHHYEKNSDFALLFCSVTTA